jgi:3-hydroxybutyryl-CoA dehydrogenase
MAKAHFVIDAPEGLKEKITQHWEKWEVSISWWEPGASVPRADAYWVYHPEPMDHFFLALSRHAVWVNAVVHTGKDLPENVLRFNGWNNAWAGPALELAMGHENPITLAALALLDTIGQKYLRAPDVPGLISPRVIANLVQEAYLAQEENVAHAKDIDTAMKLGTNYPLGPFEWAEAIGKEQVWNLLLALQQEPGGMAPPSTLQSH